MLVSTGADLCWNNRKLIGSAQFRKEGYILQHGSILYDYDKDLLEKIFKEKVDTSSIVSVKEINPNITKQDIVELLSNVNLQNLWFTTLLAIDEILFKQFWQFSEIKILYISTGIKSQGDWKNVFSK